VFIGVREDDGADREMDSALESAADYRISLSHYPTPYDLAKGVFQNQSDECKSSLAVIPKLYEQLVSVVVDNVTGKHYGRHPRWLMVEPQIGKKEKTLKCLETPECAVELRKRGVERTVDMVNALRTAAKLYSQDKRPEFQALGNKLYSEAHQLAAGVGLPT
jgi:hypothetical protein